MEKVNAVIMAGGFGTRLQPITDTMPKPLVPILNEPAMAHIIRLLCKHGIYDAAVTLKFMPDMVKSRFCDCFCGVNLKYYTEQEPMGTAGGVKQAQDFLCDNFFVISADAICDFDLGAAYDFHMRNKCDVTVLTSRRAEPLSYGIIVCAPDGRISRFLEKPSWSEVFSDTVNTGIYIVNKKMLEFVTDGMMFDFSRDLFPLLFGKGFRLFGYEAEGSWCDIGSLTEYYRCNMDALGGKYRLGCPVPEGAPSTRGSITADGFSMGENSCVLSSVVFENVKIGSGVSVTGSVICENVTVGDGVRIPDGCVIGAGSTIESGISLREGSVIPCLSEINAQTKIKSIVSASGLFSTDGIRGDYFTSFGAPELCALGAAVAQERRTNGAGGMPFSQGYKPAVVGVMYASDSVSESAAGAFLSGVNYSGGRGVDFGTGFLSMANYLNTSYELDMLVHITRSADGELRARMRDGCGLKIKKTLEDRIEKAYRSPSPAASPPELFKTERAGGAELLYFSALTRAGADLTGMKIAVAHTEPCRLLSRVFTALGAESGEYLEPYTDTFYYVETDSDASSLKICENTGTGLCTVELHRIWAIVSSYCDMTAPVSLPYSAPSALVSLIEGRGARVLYRLASPSSELAADNEAREAFFNNMLLADPLFAAVYLLSLTARTGRSLNELDASVPAFCVRDETIPVSRAERAALLRRVYEDNLPYQVSCGDGVRIKTSRAEATLTPDDDGLHIISHAADAEAASDTVDEVKKRLKEYLRTLK